MLAAFHDLRRETITEFLHYAQQLDRRDVGISDEKKPPAVGKSSRLSEKNAAEPTTTTTPKYARLPADTLLLTWSVLGGPFGNSCKPTGVTQAKITIGDACATVEAKVIKNLPYDHGLRVVYSKCMFAEKQIPFLGFLISQEGVTINLQPIAAIKKLHGAENKKRKEIVTKFGVPRTIISDNDSAFTSKTTNDYLHHHHIEHTLTVPYAPRTNGLGERANGRILPPLRKNVNGDVDHWSEYLAKTTFEVNAQFHAGLKISPFELLFNYTPRRIIDNQLQVDIHEPQQDMEMVRQEAFDNITAYLNGMKTKHDRKHPPAPYEVGDQVWYKTSSKAGKFDPWYDGPYTITDRDKETFTITRTKNHSTETRLASATQLKCFHEKTQDTTPQLHDDSVQSTQAPLATGDRRRLRKPPGWLQDFITD
ncbi:hypothetical protein MRX96_022635 [Rhipicephalus microplus]